MRKRVLVPHDLTPLCDLALTQVQALGVGAEELTVVHVLPRIDLTQPSFVWPVQDDEPRRAHALASLHGRLAHGPFAGADFHVAIGDPGNRIIELAKEIGATLIVMPTHGRKGLERAVLGSVAEHVVRFANCPVLVLPRTGLNVEHPSPTEPTGSREEQVEEIAEALSAKATTGRAFLTAARVEVGMREDLEWWEEALEQQLMNRGIEFVDLIVVHAPSGAARIASFQLEEHFA